MQISQFVRSALKTQLADDTYGFNPRQASAAAVAGVAQWAIDWSDASANFIFGRVSPEDIQASSVFTFPFVTIDILSSQNTNRVKFGTFSGYVTALIEVHHSWPEESVLADFASLVDVTEEAVINALNDPAHQSWPSGMPWNAQVRMTRSPVAMGAENWLQSAQFICTFELTV